MEQDESQYRINNARAFVWAGGTPDWGAWNTMADEERQAILEEQKRK